MEITDVKIRKMTDEEKMKAVVSITIDHSLAVHDIKIIHTGDKLFVAMPSRKTAEGEYKDIVHPINRETREMLEHRILDAYQKQIDEGGSL